MNNFQILILSVAIITSLAFSVSLIVETIDDHKKAKQEILRLKKNNNNQ